MPVGCLNPSCSCIPQHIPSLSIPQPPFKGTPSAMQPLAPKHPAPGCKTQLSGSKHAPLPLPPASLTQGHALPSVSHCWHVPVPKHMWALSRCALCCHAICATMRQVWSILAWACHPVLRVQYHRAFAGKWLQRLSAGLTSPDSMDSSTRPAPRSSTMSQVALPRWSTTTSPGTRWRDERASTRPIHTKGTRHCWSSTLYTDQWQPHFGPPASLTWRDAGDHGGL